MMFMEKRAMQAYQFLILLLVELLISRNLIRATVKFDTLCLYQSEALVDSFDFANQLLLRNGLCVGLAK